MPKSVHIAIVGAGIAGLASAIGLARSGYDVTVLEQAAEIDEVGAGMQMGPNAARALQWLGVWDTLEPETFAPKRINIRSGQTGRTLSHIELSGHFEQRFGAPYKIAHRADVIAALLRTTRELPSVSVQTDRAVTGYAPSNGSLRVDLLGGDQLSANALIGADGIRSRIRNLLLGDGPPDYAGHAIYRALTPMIDVPSAIDQTSVTLWLCPAGHVVQYPVNAGRRMNIVAAADSLWVEDGWHARADRAEVADLFRNATPILQELLSAPESWHKWAAADRRPVHHWGDGSVTLIGDAAHPSLPYLAQGAAMALEDAVRLAQHCNGEESIESAFRAYEAERQPRTARIIRRSHHMGQIYHMRSLPAMVRNIVITALPATLHVASMSWIYDWRVDLG